MYEYPSTLAGWDSRSAWEARRAGGYAVDVSNLSRELAIPRFLPVALYYCCVCFENTVAKMEMGQLSQQNRDACIVAIHKIYSLQAETTFLWLHDADDIYISCETPTVCTSTRNYLKCAFYIPNPRVNALDSWKAWWEVNMCQRCINEAKGSHEQGRIDFWKMLPGIFGLPEWEELIKE